MGKHYIPITKVDEEKRLVYMRAASETTDYADESMDYDKSKPNFQKWSDDTYERSAGKSYGNIREMHSSIAAGKLQEPLIFDDEAKTVDIVVYVSDDSSWQKVKDGVLTGASIGGSYEDIQFDPVLGVKRYVADLSEISLVDSPCNPDAVIEVIKSNGSVEMRKVINMKKSLKYLTSGLEKNLKGELKKSFSFDDIQSRLRAAITCRLKETVDTTSGGYGYGYGSYYNYGYFYVIACYDDSIVINGDFGDNGANYNIQIEYTIDDTGVVELGESNIVHMVPEVCNDNDGDNEALDRFIDCASSLMEKGVKLSNGSKEKMEKFMGGNKMTEQEQQELNKAVELVMKNYGTPEQIEALEKAKKAKATDTTKADDTKDEPAKKDDMAAAKKSKKDPDNDGDDDTTAGGDTDNDAAGKKAKKAIGMEDTLNKGMESLLGSMNKFQETMLKRIETLESQPVAGGPAVTAVSKTLGGPAGEMVKTDTPDAQIAMLKSIMDNTPDMTAREAISKQIATIEMTKARANPIVFNA